MLKKAPLILSFIVISSVSTIAQKSKEQPVQTNANISNSGLDYYSIKEKVFREALKYGDLLVAKQALYEMIAIKPSEKNLRDSLAFIYINMGSPKEAILLSREILANDPGNVNILEVKAIAQQSLGMSKEALTDYESLYSKSNSIFHLYQIATLQYELKRVAECNASIEKIINNPESEKREINIGTGNRGQQQNVSLKAAALNVKGVLAMDLNENAIAKACFENALKLNPDFVLAKNNLDYIITKAAPAKAPTGGGKQNTPVKPAK